jgi:hypothetical protein
MASTSGLCVNCEYACATRQCRDCPSEENRFCEECSGLHVRIKQFRGHQMAVMEERTRICNNCDDKIVSMMCTDCPANESLLCTECARIHKQVKKFRHHNMVPYNGQVSSQRRQRIESDTSKGPFQAIISFVVDWLDIAHDYYLMVSEYIIENGLGQPSIALCGTAMFGIILLLRLYVGRNAVIAIVIFLIVSIRYYSHYGRTELKVVIGSCVDHLSYN